MEPRSAILALLILAAGPCAAQSPEFSPPSFETRLGLEASAAGLRYRRLEGQAAVRVLEGTDAERVLAYVRRLEQAPGSANGVMRQTALEALQAKGIEPTATTPDGTVWFRRFFGLGLTADGERAIPAVLLGEAFAVVTSARASEERVGGLAEELDALSQVDFDQSGRSAAEAAVAVDGSLGSPTPAVLPRPQEGAQPAEGGPPAPAPAGSGEKVALLKEVAFHGSFLADAISTFKVLKAGGQEMNPLIAIFGAKSILGVLGMALLLHLGITWLIRNLRKKAAEAAEAAERERLKMLADTLTIAVTVVHGVAAVHNMGQLRK